MSTYKPKSSLQLYRDCLRLIQHMAGTTSQKSVMLRKIVGDQFRANKHVTDAATLHRLKSTAEKGLSNYLLFERSKQDPKIAAAAAELDHFEDDEDGNLVRVIKHSIPSARAPLSPAAAAAAAAATAAKQRAVAERKKSLAGGKATPAVGAGGGAGTGKDAMQ